MIDLEKLADEQAAAAQAAKAAGTTADKEAEAREVAELQQLFASGSPSSRLASG